MNQTRAAGVLGDPWQQSRVKGTSEFICVGGDQVTSRTHRPAAFGGSLSMNSGWQCHPSVPQTLALCSGFLASFARSPKPVLSSCNSKELKAPLVSCRTTAIVIPGANTVIFCCRFTGPAVGTPSPGCAAAPSVDGRVPLCSSLGRKGQRNYPKAPRETPLGNLCRLSRGCSLLLSCRRPLCTLSCFMGWGCTECVQLPLIPPA